MKRTGLGVERKLGRKAKEWWGTAHNRKKRIGEKKKRMGEEQKAYQREGYKGKNPNGVGGKKNSNDSD